VTHTPAQLPAALPTGFDTPASLFLDRRTTSVVWSALSASGGRAGDGWARAEAGRARRRHLTPLQRDISLAAGLHDDDVCHGTPENGPARFDAGV